MSLFAGHQMFSFCFLDARLPADFPCKEVDMEPVDVESEAVSGLPEVGEETVEEAPEELLEDAEVVEEAEVVEVEAVSFGIFCLHFCCLFL